MTQQQLIQRQLQSTVAVEAHLEALLPPSVASSLDAVVDRDYNIVAYTIDGPCPVDDLTAAIAVIDAAGKGVGHANRRSIQPDQAQEG